MGEKYIIKKILKNPFCIVGGAIVLILLVITMIAPNIVNFDYVTPKLSDRLKAPDWTSGFSGYILGTDSLGRDILSRLLIGGQYSLLLAFACVALSAIIGTVLGLISGYYGKWVDDIIMRVGDIQLSINATLLAITVVAVLGPSLVNLAIIMIITSWITFARVVRGEVMAIRNSEYVLASKALGASDIWIMFTQILPNVLTPLMILASQQIGFMILYEAALSFLGLGVQPPTPSWGVMIAESRDYLSQAPWTVLAPGFALMITVLGFNFLGDGLRDVLDPKMKTK